MALLHSINYPTAVKILLLWGFYYFYSFSYPFVHLYPNLNKNVQLKLPTSFWNQALFFISSFCLLEFWMVNHTNRYCIYSFAIYLKKSRGPGYKTPVANFLCFLFIDIQFCFLIGSLFFLKKKETTFQSESPMNIETCFKNSRNQTCLRWWDVCEAKSRAQQCEGEKWL